MSEAEDLLGHSHRRIRQGEFTPALLSISKTWAREWQQLSDASRLQGACVSAEIFDYYGRYRDAAAAFQQDEIEGIVRSFKALKPGRSNPLLKRRLWLVMGYAQSLYRAERYKDARLLLEDCAAALAVADDEEQFCGTRAHLAANTGQVLRQLNQYSDAITQFTESIRFANARFRQKTKFAEFTTAEIDTELPFSSEQAPVFEASRRLAHWTIAKSLALGTGWIKYTTGRLEDAGLCLSTGAALLRTTHDSIHRAYCQLLMGAVARARHAGNAAEMHRAVVLMKDASPGLSKHPLFAARAHYELAIAYLHLKDMTNAREALAKLDDLLRKATTSTPGGHLIGRWICNALILKSRLARFEGHAPRAEDLAMAALKRARKGEHLSCQVEALIAAAEAASLRRSDRASSLDRAIEAFETARQLDESNPKTAAVCSLHLASVHGQRGDAARARAEFGRWHMQYEALVEHGFVRRLADEVKSHLWSSGDAFTLEGVRYDANHRRLKGALLTTVRRSGISKAEQARQLGLRSARTITRWERDLARNRPGR